MIPSIATQHSKVNSRKLPKTRRSAPYLRPFASYQTDNAPLSSSTPTSTINLAEYIVRDGGPPRLCSLLPSPINSYSSSPRSDRPLMIYLPGIDGTGLAASRQFPSLLRVFDLITFVTPPEDRSDFTTLTDIITSFVKEEVPLHPPTRPIYLLGESFGGILALAVAAECPGFVDRVVLVNPATSFSETIWPLIGPLLPQAPEQLYSALPIALAPILGNPINLLAAAIDATPEDAGAGERVGAALSGAAQLLAQLPLLTTLLPPETLSWKLSLLQEGCEIVEPKLHRVTQRTLILVGDQDLLIPSREEGPRLAKTLAQAHLRVEKGRSHALLQEGGIDLVAIMEEEGALVTKRRLSAPMTSRAAGGGFGAAVPIELPSEKELERYGERTTALGRRLTSPIFISTSAEGVKTLGLGNVPSCESDGRPVLYVGNHQTLALDLGVLCEEFLKERDVMLRGLAHPVIFAESMGKNSAEKESSSSSRDNNDNNLFSFDIIPAFGQLISQGNGLLPNPFNMNRNNSQRQPADGRQAFAEFFKAFGAVPVSARNLIRLLTNGESVLLFPGGVREAYKRKGEEYKLFWPQRAEFVRMAAKYNAIIVPFAAIGVDDSLEILLDGNELQNAPIVGPMVSSRAANMPQARRGVAANSLENEPESFVSPLAVPKLPPSRLYFQFQKPISTSSADLNDRDRVDELYREVQNSVQSGLDELLVNRERDPYKDFGKRVLYEAARGGTTQAPTYPLE